jgi:threonine/homoserine/homoserine lactone efflux protein
LLWFSGVMALGQFSPGPDFVLVTRTALAGGARAGVWTAAGIATGLTLHATVAVGGTAALFQAGGWLAATMRWAAVVYLAWLGMELLRGALRPRPAGASGAQAAECTARRCWHRGLWCNLLNPKVALFLAAAAAPFLGAGRSPAWAVAVWAVIVGQGFVLWVAWACLLQVPPVKRLHSRAAAGIDATFGVALLALALRLAFA